MLAWPVKQGFIRNWVPWARAVRNTATLFSFAGHDWGGVGVEVIGVNKHCRISIVADTGGQRIAVLPAAVMVESLLAGQERRGLASTLAHRS